MFVAEMYSFLSDLIHLYLRNYTTDVSVVVTFRFGTRIEWTLLFNRFFLAYVTVQL